MSLLSLRPPTMAARHGFSVLVCFLLLTSLSAANARKSPTILLHGVVTESEQASLLGGLAADFDALWWPAIPETPPALRICVGSYCAELTNPPSILINHKRIVHFPSAKDVTIHAVWSRFFELEIGNPQALLQGGPIRLSPSFVAGEPLVSVFTTTYRSGERIMRPFRTLQAQTYTNWEWVILDDSSDEGATFARLATIQALDSRIRTYLPRRSSGFIGAVKRSAAGMAFGKILVELDHDDELEPNCLANIVAAFQRNPDSGFVYTDAAEVFEEGKSNWAYVEGYAFGFGAYYQQFSHATGTWVNAARTPELNVITLSDIVGVPNHVRAWRADLYHMIGGHTPALLVADDYDLLIRTFLTTTMTRIPRLGYIQYRNRQGNNFTFLRNAEIRKLQARLSAFYREAVLARLAYLGLPTIAPASYSEYVSGTRLSWEHPSLPQASRDDLSTAGQSVVMLVHNEFDLPIVDPATIHSGDVIIIGYNGFNPMPVLLDLPWLNDASSRDHLRVWSIKSSNYTVALQYAIYVAGTRALLLPSSISA